MVDAGKFRRLTPGIHAAPAPALSDVPQTAKILKVTAAGATFVLAEMPGLAYGPAPWGLGQYATPAAAITAGYQPLPGDRALVVFAGIGVETPWVLSWWR